MSIIFFRRRRLDGALNRVPMGFYAKIWKILESCQAIVIQGKVLGTQLTQEVRIHVNLRFLSNLIKNLDDQRGDEVCSSGRECFEYRL